MSLLPASAALLIIDVQRAIDHPSWGVRNHPVADQRIADLLDWWRQRRMPIYHVRHDSVEPRSTYRPGQPGHEFKPEAAPRPDEPVIPKSTSSAFVNTGLEARLRGAEQAVLVVAGVITNNSVEATVRHTGCLGFNVYLAEDACFTFGRPDWNGVPRSADEIHAMSLANLHGEYCTVTTPAEIRASLASAPPQ